MTIAQFCLHCQITSFNDALVQAISTVDPLPPSDNVLTIIQNNYLAVRAMLINYEL